MGSFLGHLIPGIFFISFGYLWMIETIKKWLITSKYKKGKFQSLPALFKTKGHIYIDGIIMLICSLIGMFIEIPYNYLTGEKLVMPLFQHEIMYASFGLVGLVVTFQKCLSRCIPDMEKIVYMLLTQAYFITALQFQQHVIGRNRLDTMLHLLLAYCLYSAAIMTVCELKFRNSVLCVMMRSFLTVLAGTWITQIGLIVFHPFSEESSWDPDSNRDMKMMTIIFSLHMIIISISILFICIVINFMYKHRMIKTIYEIDLEDEFCKDLLAENDENDFPELQLSIP